MAISQWGVASFIPSFLEWARLSREIATAIPNAQLQMYPQWGHGLYEEEKGFNKLVLDFLNRNDKL